MRRARQFLLFVVLAVVLPACPGDDDESWRDGWRSRPDDPLEVVYRYPNNSSNNARPLIHVRFNHVLSIPSIVPGSMRLRDEAGDEVPGTVTPQYATSGACNGVAFLPGFPLSLAQDYTATVTTDILDTEGESLSEEYVWQFTIRPQTYIWFAAHIIESDDLTGQAILPCVIESPLWDQMIWLEEVVQEDLSYRYNVWSQYGSALAGSGPEKCLDDAGDFSAPHLAGFPQGGIVAAAHHDSAEDRHELWLRRFSWEDGLVVFHIADYLGDAVGPVESPQVAIDSDADALAIVAMVESTDPDRGIYSTWSLSGTEWTELELLDALDDADMKRPRLSMNTSGQAFAVWEVEKHASPYHLRGARYDKTADPRWTWVGSLDDTPFAGTAQNPGVTIDEDGDSFVVWAREDDTTSSVWALCFAAADTAPPAPVELSAGLSGNAETPHVAAHSNGTIFVVWVQSTGPFIASLMARRHVPDSGWQDAVTLWTGPRCLEPFIATGGPYEAIVVWHDDETVMASHYLWEDNWSGMEAISSDGGVTAEFVEHPRVAIHAGGTAEAVWQQMDYRWTIRRAYYR